MAWSIRSESAPLTLDWYLSLHLTPSEIARVKRRRDWGEIQAALIDGIRQMDPTAARALARRQGLLPALTDRQHTAVVRHTAQKPAQARSNPRRRPNTARAMQELQGRLGALLDRSRNPYRANASGDEEFGYEVNVAAAWQAVHDFDLQDLRLDCCGYPRSPTEWSRRHSGSVQKPYRRSVFS